MMSITDNDGITYNVSKDRCTITSFDIKLTPYDYALVNYKEIIDWYKQPFYKRWFSNPPQKEFVSYTKQP